MIVAIPSDAKHCTLSHNYVIKVHRASNLLAQLSAQCKDEGHLLTIYHNSISSQTVLRSPSTNQNRSKGMRPDEWYWYLSNLPIDNKSNFCIYAIKNIFAVLFRAAPFLTIHTNCCNYREAI